MAYPPHVELRKYGSARKRPLWLRNSKGSHLVVEVRKLNARWYSVRCSDGTEYTLPPEYRLWRRA